MTGQPARLLIVSDTHCGHPYGLTPPEWQAAPTCREGVWQAALWAWWSAVLDEIGPVDLAVHNGDAIDGDSSKDGGTGQITTDRLEQVEIAYDALAPIKARQWGLVAGTGYHTGKAEQFEAVLASRLSAWFGPSETVDLAGTIFHFRHHLGSSSIPHGRATALLREALWSDLQSLIPSPDRPRPHVLVRSHVHYHVAVQDRYHLAMTTPALQGWTRYGAERMTGRTDVGLILFEVSGPGQFVWTPYFFDAPAEAGPPVRRMEA